MTQLKLAAAWLGALSLAAPAAAQPVEVTPLAAPDLFSTAGRETGLPPELWQGTSSAIARAVLPVLAAKPLSPAAAALARRVLATGANGPAGAGRDSALAGARVAALIAQGDLKAGAAILSRTPGLDRDPDLSKAAAEAALLAQDTDRACGIADGLGVGRDDSYWLRLRAYCQARAGQLAAAQLTFDLAQAKASDPVYGRLMAVKLGGAAKPGAASLRNGLDYALSRDLGLDLAAAKPAPAVAAAMAGVDPGPPTWTVEPGAGEARAALVALGAGDLARAQQIRAALTEDQPAGPTPLDLAVLDAALGVSAAKPDGPTLDRLIERGGVGEARARARAQAAALWLAALGAPMSEAARGELAGFAVPEGKGSAAHNLTLEMAADAKRIGETALLALWIAADAGPAGPAPADRARIIRALAAVGLEADARAFALEGLLALK
jgi:hypothetical protein